MSRRRKYGDSSAPKNTPRTTAASEECSSVVEPGSRRLRSARRSVLRVAGEGPPGPTWQQEQRPAVASGINSNPEERYETPRRVLKMDFLSCTFSSPNDPDGQNDIFWDQNSPMTKQLGKGKRKQIYTTGSDEISDIVNRIAPQDEKPTTNSMLGMWIGASAIPCTPSVAKEKSRVKISCTKLKTQNREKELMKLAKQFDKNMEELDVIQEQNKRNHDFIQAISETEALHNYNDCVQMHPVHDMVPKIDNAIIKTPMKGNTRISVANDQNSSQKPFDQNAEAAFNAIFDGSTQNCSGRLSQDLSDASLNTSKNALKEEKIITNGTVVTEELPSKIPDSLYPRVDLPIMTKSCVTPYNKEPEASSKHMGTFTTSDFEDDWERVLSNEPFVMQNVEMLEHFPSRTAQITDHKGICTFISKKDESISRTNKSLDAKLGYSKILQDLPAKKHNREPIDTGKYRFLSNPNDKSRQLSSTGNKMKFGKSFSKIVIQDKTQDCTVASNLTKVKEDIPMNFTSNVNTSEKKSALNTKLSSEQKNKFIFDQSFKVPVNIDPFDTSTLDRETIINKTDQTCTSKLGSFFDDWNDPSLANEIIKACHQLETSWEADDVDDDLLYQACDDIERLTQQQDILKDSKTSESILEINNSSKHEAKNMSTISKQGSQLAQSNHLNLGSITVQASSLTDRTQINKSVKMEKREMSRNSPDFLGTTTDLTLYSKNSNCQMNNLHVNNSDVPIQAHSSRSVFIGSSSLNVNSNQMSTVIATNKKLNTHQPSHRPQTDEAQSELNKAVRFSKYTFTKTKNPQILSQLNQNCVERSLTVTKIIQGFEKKKTVNSLLGEADQQKSLVKISESLKQSSKEEDEKNRKYSPEEIQRKRQEALVRRMAKAQASSVNSTPT
ncbi:ewing's tumor-associated antigen 1 isoform X1 [Sciurus carolinensis]|uniref:ewing's tumor-associated antigen 1 isoform X1 n=3 Tax=Sciurus carolinensis TaxID=30640 RepID=UPI001FB3C8BC|nr:ewing's tumor-associated antigen 1 isoform X1 [Sciurus carolinensis]